MESENEINPYRMLFKFLYCFSHGLISDTTELLPDISFPLEVFCTASAFIKIRKQSIVINYILIAFKRTTTVVTANHKPPETKTLMHSLD